MFLMQFCQANMSRLLLKTKKYKANINFSTQFRNSVLSYSRMSLWWSLADCLVQTFICLMFVILFMTITVVQLLIISCSAAAGLILCIILIIVICKCEYDYVWFFNNCCNSDKITLKNWLMKIGNCNTEESFFFFLSCFIITVCQLKKRRQEFDGNNDGRPPSVQTSLSQYSILLNVYFCFLSPWRRNLYFQENI